MRIGFALCGSFCTLDRALEQMRLLATEHEIVPVMSFSVASTDTRFGTADSFCRRTEAICGRPIVKTIAEAEPLGPRDPLGALVICPCTGNTLAKLACGVTDTPVTMAAKAHMRSGGTLLIALASNDALSANLKNVAALLMRKNVYFVPLKQDDVKGKPHSLVCDFSEVGESLRAALDGRQLRPLFI